MGLSCFFVFVAAFLKCSQGTVENQPRRGQWKTNRLVYHRCLWGRFCKDPCEVFLRKSSQGSVGNRAQRDMWKTDLTGICFERQMQSRKEEDIINEKCSHGNARIAKTRHNVSIISSRLIVQVINNLREFALCYERHPESMRTVPWLRPAGRDSAPPTPVTCSNLRSLHCVLAHSTSPKMTPNR